MSGTHAPVVVVAAVEAELRLLGAGHWSTLLLGVGVVEAALSLAALNPARVRELWLVGSAGAYPGSGLQLGDAVLTRGYRYASAEALDPGRAYLPEPLPTLAQPKAPVGIECPLPRVVALTTPAITKAESTARLLGRQGAVEHLEVFAAARWAQRHQLPFAAVLGIANRVGTQAHEEWLIWRERAEGAAARSLRALLLERHA